ncbi:hypothetical protein EB233_31485 [Mesorhizobium erdmanii]|uniref:Transposase IS116/IS110/IS902 C-terminal domain-containing protein n=1 Tax=Mesorhizobium erdmanii TaxID=1777866 RepID=A0A6M7UQJ6_9HYPH|nr:hypothetical protein EB233_31485 [Mesorhizobium erdmanii]
MSMPSWMRDGACSAPVFDALQAMRGIAVINALCRARRSVNFTRFSNPRQLMAYFGLVPGEQSSGETVWRGGITEPAILMPGARWSKAPGLTGWERASASIRSTGSRRCRKSFAISGGKRKFDCAPEIVG